MNTTDLCVVAFVDPVLQVDEDLLELVLAVSVHELALPQPLLAVLDVLQTVGQTEGRLLVLVRYGKTQSGFNSHSQKWSNKNVKQKTLI